MAVVQALRRDEKRCGTCLVPHLCNAALFRCEQAAVMILQTVRIVCPRLVRRPPPHEQLKASDPVIPLAIKRLWVDCGVGINENLPPVERPRILLLHTATLYPSSTRSSRALNQSTVFARALHFSVRTARGASSGFPSPPDERRNVNLFLILKAIRISSCVSK